MTLTLIGDLEDLELSFSLKWEEVGLFIHVNSYIVDTHTQEYDVVFPEEVPFSGTLKLNNKTADSIRGSIITWVDSPKRNKKKLLNEIVKEVKEFIENELNKEWAKESLIVQVLEGEVLV